MLRFTCFLAFLMVTNLGFGATVTWTGATDNNWSTPNNWSPNQVPLDVDDVVIDADVNITNVPNQSINSLSIITGRVVTLQGTGTLLTVATDIIVDVSSTLGTTSLDLSVAGSCTVSGVLNMNASNTISGAGSFTLSSGAKISTSHASGLNGSITVGGTKTFDPAGLYELNGSAAQVTGSLLPSNISGTFTVSNSNASGVTLTDDLTLTGTSHVIANGSKLIIPLGKKLTNEGTITLTGTGSISNLGTINGTGTLSGNFNNQTKLAPGNSAGTITISGTYTAQPATSSHDMEIFSLSSFDKINVGGTATLGGALNVTLAPGYTPNPGESFNLMTNGSNSGTFSSTSFPPGYIWGLTYTGGVVKLLFDGPLPVELTKFSGTSHDKSNMLTWESASELNFDKYVIERASDNRQESFSTIAEVTKKAPLNQAASYKFEDTNPLALSYYRLKMMDLDGTYKYSKIIVLENTSTATGNVLVYPNPTQHSINVAFVSDNATDYLITITDLSGKIMSRISYESYAGNNIKEINIANFPAGFYQVNISGGNINQNVKIIKE